MRICEAGNNYLRGNRDLLEAAVARLNFGTQRSVLSNALARLERAVLDARRN